MCHVAFSWHTGLVDRGDIHNPEMFRWMRERAPDGEIPRNAGAAAGGGGAGGQAEMPPRHALARKMALAKTPVQQVDAFMHSLYRHDEILRQTDRLAHPAEQVDNNELRIHYLLGHIDRDGLKKRLVQQEKKRAKEFAIRHAYVAYTNQTRDVYAAYMSDAVALMPTLDRVREIAVATNQSLAVIRKQFDATIVPIKEVPPRATLEDVVVLD